MATKEIFPKQALSKLSELVRQARLTQLEREDYTDAIRDLELMHGDWERLKKQNQQSKPDQ